MTQRNRSVPVSAKRKSRPVASRSRVSRRDFLATSAVATSALAAGSTAAFATRVSRADDAPADGASADNRVAFFLIGDTHYLANKESPEKLDERSAAVTTRLIDLLNELPGTAIPDAAGGGTVAKPRGLIHAGDLIDTGDKTGAVQQRMQRTEWQAYVADFGLNGSDGKLRYPVYEVHGNHDGPRGQGVAIDGIIERNKNRPGLKNVAPNGLHCSWDWGPVHFVNLGIVVGQVKEVAQVRRYNPLDSLDFLVADLKQHVGESKRPVVITHHVDVMRYSGPCDPTDKANLSKEWHPCDAHAYYEALAPYNVLAILYGHTHARNVLTWNGTHQPAEKGLTLFNVDNSSHFAGVQQAFLYFEISEREMIVRECGTKDAWQTRFWTPQTWRRPVAS